jgi:proteasome lid subunit RPN8/RPN11
MNLSGINPAILEEIKDHCRGEFPKEACGVVSDGKVIVSQNLATNTNDFFVIDPKIFQEISKVDFIWHSHCQDEDFSMADISTARNLMLPMYLFKLPIGKEDLYDPTVVQPLEGRTFVYWIADCWALVKDWYEAKGIKLPDPPRELKDADGLYDWDRPGWNMYQELLPQRFDRLEPTAQIQDGDLILSTIRFESPPEAPDTPNHIAIVVNATENSILEHMYKNLSGKKVYGQERRKMTHSVWRLRE